MTFRATVDDTKLTMQAGQRPVTIAHMSTSCSGELKRNEALSTFNNQFFSLELHSQMSGVWHRNKIMSTKSIVVPVSIHTIHDLVWFGFYGPFKNISLISSRSLIRGGGKPEYPEKNHLTYRCRTWHLTCDPSAARTHSGERSNV